jgi:transcriptional regulator with XRE-family HTH domain
MKEIGIARVLTHMRREKGVTQDELAAHVGVSKASVSKWETGQSYPDIALLPILAAYFGITIDELLCYEPQMEKRDVEHLYLRLAEAFAVKPFADVRAEAREAIKKYYSCWPLLFRIAALFVNHHMLAPEAGERTETLREAAELCARVRAESGDLDLAKEAALLEAVCRLMLGAPREALALLGDGKKPIMAESALIAQAHQMLGEMREAAEVAQIAIYQALILLVGAAPTYLAMVADDKGKAEETIHRTLVVAETYNLDGLHSNTMAQLYLAAAQFYAMQGSTDEALGMLKRYATLCAVFSFELHGDAYFDLLGGWLSRLDLGARPPRSKSVIRESMLEVVEANPAFQPLRGDARYREIILALKDNMGGSHGHQ